MYRFSIKDKYHDHLSGSGDEPFSLAAHAAETSLGSCVEGCCLHQGCLSIQECWFAWGCNPGESIDRGLTS